MTRQPIQYRNYEEALSDVQGDLLEILLQSEQDVYPWNPSEFEADTYFAELEHEFTLDDWQEDEKSTRKSQAFFSQLHQSWNSPFSRVHDALTELLSKQFAIQAPESWIEAIADQAKRIFQTNLPLADQLVQCVQPLLPNWAEDDLLVLARPWAYAMRGGSDTFGDKSSNVARSSEWTELSQMEQVRLSLAIAHTALAQLKDSTGDRERL